LLLFEDSYDNELNIIDLSLDMV